MKIWMIMLALGVGTFLIRYSLIGLMGKIHIPPRIERAFRFIPASMLSALVVSQLASYARSSVSPLTNPYYLAALVACGVAWKTRNTLLTVFMGMIVLWVLRALSC
jgi:branched-subunit amino acid transport protein